MAYPEQQQAYPPLPPEQQQAYPPPQDPGYPPPQQAGYPPPQNPGYAAPPPAAYPPPQQQQTATTVVVTQQPVIQNVVFRDHPVTVTDSNGQQVTTVLQYRAGALTWIICAVLCLFLFECGFCCFALIPFCISATKDVYHITPTDGKVVGVYKRI